MIVANWAANAPLAFTDQYISNLKQLHVIAFDAGSYDISIAASIKVLDSTLNNYSTQHTYEEYEGDHINSIGDRIGQKMLPFFSDNLPFGVIGKAK